MGRGCKLILLPIPAEAWFSSTTGDSFDVLSAELDGPASMFGIVIGVLMLDEVSVTVRSRSSGVNVVDEAKDNISCGSCLHASCCAFTPLGCST